MTQLAMIVGRNLNFLRSAMPDLRPHERERLKGFVNQFVAPIGLILLALLAYKFWA